MDDEDFFTDPSYAFHLANIHHKNEQCNGSKRNAEKQHPVIYRLNSSNKSTEQIGTNTGYIAVVVSAFVGFVFFILCLHIWFNLLP